MCVTMSDSSEESEGSEISVKLAEGSDPSQAPAAPAASPAPTAPAAVKLGDDGDVFDHNEGLLSSSSPREQRDVFDSASDRLFDTACDTLLSAATLPYHAVSGKVNPTSYEDNHEFRVPSAQAPALQAPPVPVSARLSMDHDDGTDDTSTPPGALLPPRAPADPSQPVTAKPPAVDPVASKSEKERTKLMVLDLWEKAGVIREKAVSAAEKATEERVRKTVEEERKQMITNYEERIRMELEEAKQRTWAMANKQQEQAVEMALREQQNTLDRTRQELADQSGKAKQELDEAYHTIKKELVKDMQEEHRRELSKAVREAWECATREKEQAVAAAVERARAGVLKETTDSMAQLRMTLRAELREGVATSKREAEDKYSAAISTSKQTLAEMRSQMKNLKQELEEAKAAVAEAERRAAHEQQTAVREAVAAVEEVHKQVREKALRETVAMPHAGAVTKPFAVTLDAGTASF